MVQPNQGEGGESNQDDRDRASAKLTAEDQRWDKLGLFILAGMLILVLAGVVVGLFVVQKPGEAVAGLLGMIIGGVLTRLNDVFKLVSDSWAGVQWGALTKKLGDSKPADSKDEVKEVKVVNPPEDPVNTTETTGADGNPWDGEAD